MVKMDGYNTDFFKNHSLSERLAEVTEQTLSDAGVDYLFQLEKPSEKPDISSFPTNSAGDQNLV